MKTNLIIFFFLMLSFSVRGDEALTFYFEYCLKKSTHIFKTSMVDSSGTIMIHEVLKGKSKKKVLTLPYFAKAKERFPNYFPSDGLSGWELILFMQEDSLQKDTYRPVIYIEMEEYRDFELALSILWQKEGEAYYSFQPSNPGPVVFGSWGSVQPYLTRIDAYRKLELHLKKYNVKNLVGRR